MSELREKRLIWVVDDSPTDSSRASKVLGAEYRVETFSDGSSAIEKLGTGAIPDLLLIDWMMPGVSGIELCQFVRSSPGRIANIPVILLTSQHGTSEIVEAFASGANDYISKPFVDQELKARVRTLVAAGILLERAETAELDVRSLLMHAPDAIFVVTAEGLIMFANEAALAALGASLEHIASRPINSVLPGLEFHAGKQISVEQRRALPDLKIGERVFSPSFRGLPSDRPSATTISLRDVTERRTADARRLDFYSIIAHDLRTPITSALMRLQFALRGKHGVLPVGLVADLQKMETSLRSQVAMVNDFLELARLEGSSYQLDVTSIDMSELIIKAMDDFQPLLDKNAQKWIHIAPEKAAFAIGDAQRMTQVLANLIGNAIKFTPPSGTITTRVEISGEHILTTIEDNGRGIAASEINSLFDRFTRVKESSKDVVGSGLGLMIVREIITAHHGTVGVESQVNVGSRFWFRLPVSGAEARDKPRLL